MEKTVFIVSLFLLLSSSTAILIVKFNKSGKKEQTQTLEPAQKNPEFLNIRVEILNGCGREGLASVCARKLRMAGFDVINGLGQNADYFDYPASIVIDRSGQRRNAELVANAIGIKNVLTQKYGDTYKLEDVTVIIGKDWDKLGFTEEVLEQ